MKSERFIEILKESFIKDDPTFELDDLLAYETKAVRLVQTGRVYREDIMKLPQFLGREWLLKDRTYTDPATGETHPTRWNMTTDGDYLLFTYNQMLFFIIEAEELDVQQARWSIEAFFKPTDDSAQRAELVKTLGEVLVKKMMPFSLLYSGELETKHRVHLRMIQKDEHQHMRYKPEYGKVPWMRNGVLPWGSTTGWDITLDGRIACCRVGYDEYYNFLIQPLNDEQVEYYRAKHFVRNSSEMAAAIDMLDNAAALRLHEFLVGMLGEYRAKLKKMA
jgi:hypothetical protein